jgi:DNA invertase Pin-like site-specific DNA recombinase
MAGLAAARARGRVGGRPKALSSQRLQHARELASTGVPVAEIADVLLVGRSTLYRALRADSQVKTARTSWQ